MEQLETVLVIRPIHNAQARTYEYRPVMVPVEAAEIQLSKKDEDRNSVWKGVRYATDDEIAEYENKPAQVEEKKRGRPSTKNA